MTQSRYELDDIGREFVAARDDRAVTEELDDEAVVYHEEHATMHVLNPTATVVWDLLDGSATLGELIDALAEASDVDAGTVEADVLALARDLGRMGLLEGFAPEQDGKPEVQERKS